MQQRNEVSACIQRPWWFLAALITLMISDFFGQMMLIRFVQVQPLPALWVVGTLVTLSCLVRSTQPPTTAHQVCQSPSETGRHE